MRRIFWQKSSINLDKITCPSEELLSKIKKENIFENKKIYYLQDAIINLDRFKKPEKVNLNYKSFDRKIILSVWRLTKQKNYQYGS